MSKSLKDLLAELHIGLAKELLERVQSGNATPADLNVARQLLKDNGIQSLPEANKPLALLGVELPKTEADFQ